jgi:hypothetical protein
LAKYMFVYFFPLFLHVEGALVEVHVGSLMKW